MTEYGTVARTLGVEVVCALERPPVASLLEGMGGTVDCRFLPVSAGEHKPDWTVVLDAAG